MPGPVTGGVPVQINFKPGVVSAGGLVRTTLTFGTAQPSGTKVYLAYIESASNLLVSPPPYVVVSGSSHTFDIDTNPLTAASGSAIVTANLGDDYGIGSFYVRG